MIIHFSPLQKMRDVNFIALTYQNHFESKGVSFFFEQKMNILTLFILRINLVGGWLNNKKGLKKDYIQNRLRESHAYLLHAWHKSCQEQMFL